MPVQIADAVASACAALRQRAVAPAQGNSTDRPSGGQLTLHDLMATARQQAGQELGALAQKVEPLSTWNDIVLPDDALVQLRELCGWVAHRQRVLGAWGFGQKLSRGKGVNALFSGPSGTGKTMAAEIIANELSLDLYKIDLSSVRQQVHR